MKIDIQIDKIVLNGIELSSRQIESLRETIQSELAKGAMELESFSTLKELQLRSLETDSVNFDQRSAGRQLGNQIANSIFGGLSK